MSFIFEWDKEKAEENIIKHGIDFEEAKSAFYDYFANTFYDEKHSQIEDRFVIIGYSKNNRLLFVSFPRSNA